jgi:WD repeat-containing protein 55
MVSLSSSHITSDVIVTGSSDGLVRVIQIHPSKFLGVIAEHGGSTDGDQNDSKEGLPVERMKLDRRGKWLGSISHDEILKLTDIEGALEASDSDEESKEQEEDGSGDEKDQVEEEPEDQNTNDTSEPPQEDDSDSSQADTPPPDITTSRLSKKRRRKEPKREEAKKRKMGGGPSNGFFDGL